MGRRQTLTMVCWLACCAPLAAQDAANPFGTGAPGADPFAGGAAAVAPAAPPPTGAPGQPPAAAPGTAEGPAAADEKNPVVLAIRDSKPSTPKQLMFAVYALYEIGRTDEAKTYLKQLIDARPDRDQLESLHREYSSAFFYRFSQDHRLQPEGEQFGRAVLDAAHDASRDPQRLREALGRLADPSPATRRLALQELRAAGDAVVPVVLAALDDPQRSGEHAAIRQAVVDVGPSLIPPLLGALESPSEGLRRQAILTLGQYRAPQAVPRIAAAVVDPQVPEEVRSAAREAMQSIAGQVPSQADVESYLADRIRDYYDGALPAPLDYEDQVTLWRWDEKSGTVVPYRCPREIASRMTAAQLSRDLHRLSPSDPAVRQLLLTTMLDFAKTDAGLDQPLPRQGNPDYDAAVAAGAPALEQVLDRAMERGYAVAAMAAAEVLGDIGDGSLVAAESGQPRPLVQALRFQDRRVRLAAADAIMQLDPRRPYPGSSYLPEALGYLIRTTGFPRVLVAHPRVEPSRTLAGMLEQLGYEADLARSGNEAFRLASQNPDYEFVLVSDALSGPAAAEAIQMFRRDPRTAGLPIGLMAREDNLQRAADTAELDPRTLSFPRPHDVATTAFQAERLKQLAGRELVGYDERLDQASRALAHLATLAASPDSYGFYDLYRQQDALAAALFTESLTPPAARILGALGSPDAQRALVTLASQHARPLAQRQAAVQGFAMAVRDHGLMLTRDEVLQQYDRYNQSATQDAGAQQVLAALLDAIEAPSHGRPPAADAAGASRP